MRLIIDIDENDYEFLQDSHLTYDLSPKQSTETIRGANAILRLVDSLKNCIPLEDFIKNRKKPIDKDILKAYLKENKQYPFIDLPNMECDNNGNYIYIKENR